MTARTLSAVLSVLIIGGCDALSFSQDDLLGEWVQVRGVTGEYLYVAPTEVTQAFYSIHQKCYSTIVSDVERVTPDSLWANDGDGTELTIVRNGEEATYDAVTRGTGFTSLYRRPVRDDNTLSLEDMKASLC